MSDTPGNGADKATNEQPQAALTINGQYIKDLSFEAPNSPIVLTELQNQQPEIKINVNITTAKLEGPNAPANLHEVVLELHAALMVGEKTGYIVELKYGGVFTVNVPEENHAAVLLIECPRMLFPFARQILSDTTQGGGFLPLMLQPIDFAAMYLARAQHEVSAIEAEIDQVIADKS